MIGPGKYDDICTEIRKQVGVDDTGGGVVLIVFGGNKGPGFSIQCDLPTALVLPDILEEVAKMMRRDAAALA